MFTPLKSDFDSKPSKREENILIQEKVNKDCLINVVSEIEEPLSKQLIFDELPFKGNIQHCFGVPNMENNVLCREQLVMEGTCKNELKISHDLLMVTPSQGDEFNLVKVKEDEIRKRLFTYDKVFLQVFSF